MTLESRADFARRMGWNRSSVTRAVADGRVVLVDDQVDVETSLQKINALSSPYPHHQAHARQLEEQRQQKETPALPASKESVELLNLRLKKADADKREYEAEIARMDRDIKAGNLIAREDVEFVLDDFGATLRSLMENFADRYAPIVHPLQTIEETHAALSEAAQDVLQTLHDLIKRHAHEKREAA